MIFENASRRLSMRHCAFIRSHVGFTGAGKKVWGVWLKAAKFCSICSDTGRLLEFASVIDWLRYDS